VTVSSCIVDYIRNRLITRDGHKSVVKHRNIGLEFKLYELICGDVTCRVVV
jgi:hypothetical protein